MEIPIIKICKQKLGLNHFIQLSQEM